MKKFSKVTRSLIAIIICFTMMMGFASCRKPGNESNKAEITFDMQISATEITKGSDVSVFGVVKGSEDTSYEVVVKNVNGSDGASYIDIVSNGALYTLKVNKNVSEEMQVVVEGYPNAKPDLVKSSTLYKSERFRLDDDRGVDGFVEEFRKKNLREKRRRSRTQRRSFHHR